MQITFLLSAVFIACALKVSWNCLKKFVYWLEENICTSYFHHIQKLKKLNLKLKTYVANFTKQPFSRLLKYLDFYSHLLE